MELVADILLVAGALGAGFYCFVLARRLNRFNDLEKGVGGAVAVLSAQVDDLNKTLNAARLASDGSNTALTELTNRAETVAGRLELMMASLHDIPEAVPEPPVPVEAEAKTVLSSSNAESGPMFMRHERTQKSAAL